MFLVEKALPPIAWGAPRFAPNICRLAAALLIAASASAAASVDGLTGKPLASKSAARGSTMFTTLPAENTGVRTENRYADPKMWGERYQEFAVGAMGSGVAIGDYDSDSRPDLFVVSKTESCRLFRNLGGFKFEDVTEQTGVGDRGDAAMIWKQGASFADVNNDGRLDLYVCRFNAPNLLYVNQGDGTFKEMAATCGVDLVDASGMANFCDYDRDGWLDVFIVTNLLNIAEHPHGQRDHLLHNNRDGTFARVTDRAGISGEGQAHSAAWWDFDNDGWPDLYVANDFGIADKLYRNHGDGTFTDVLGQMAPHTSFSSMGSDLGDVNNDGRIDFLVADMANSTHEKDQRGMVNQRASMKDPPANAPGAPKYQRSALLLNTGTPRFLEAAILAGISATDWTWCPRFEDLDNDGRLDYFATNGMNREQNNIDLLARTMVAETLADRVRVMREGPILNETNWAYRNLGDLQFEEVGATWGLNHKGVSFGAAFGDLDGDGDLDLVYANYQAGVSLLRNDSDTGHRIVIDLRGTISNRFGIGAVVKLESAAGVQVRQLWLARGYMSSSEPMVHFGLGDDTQITRLTVTWPSGQVQTFADLPVDQRFTITEPESSPAMPTPAAEPRPPGQFAEVSQSTGLSLRSREEIVDETYVQRLLPVRLNRRGPALAVGSITAGQPEAIVVGGTTLDPLRILQPTGAGSYVSVAAPAPANAVPANDGPVLLFDADGDDDNDLLVTKGGNSLPAEAPEYQPQLFLNDGQGGFQPAPDGTLPPLPINVGAVAAADFDRDGRLDLWLGARVLTGQYPTAPLSSLLRNRGGRFEDVTDALAPALRDVGLVTAALASDVDGDGWTDLLLALEWGHVKFFRNRAGHGFEDATESGGFAAAGTGWWTSLAAADFNGDGRLDYAAGNVGLNTPYRASAAHPALLFSGDFQGNGSPQLIEAYYEGDTLYPRRSRKDLGAAIPSILKRFPRNDYYARASLETILGQDKLAAADRFAATELRSGVFLSQPDGTHRFTPLPRLAQIAPVQGMVAGDFDGDGRADLYAVQNSYAPIPSVGRFDGGLSQLLLGDGRGHFRAVPVAESDLLVPGDAKALVVLDLDQNGWPDFLLSRNHDTTLAFRNQRVVGRNALRVTLRGPAGNPSAVGALLTLTLADGSSQAAEVHAGSGCYSQSSPAVFFGFPDATPPALLRVRWPNGSSSSQLAVPPSSTSIVVSPP